MTESERDACPKCGAARVPDEAACTRCGLRVDRWSTFDAKPAPDPHLDPVFAALSARWSDPAAHDAFIGLARSLASLDAAAARYQEVMRERAGDAQAERALQQIVFLATQAHETAPSETARLFRAVYYLGVTVGIGLVVALALMVARILRH